MKQTSVLFLLGLLFPIRIPAQTLQDLSWMSGYWTETNGEHTAEELWSSPTDELMIGFHRDTFADRPAFFEYLRIEQTDSSITYWASPQGKTPPTSFTLIRLYDQRAIFENLTHNFPQRIIYTRTGNILTARIENASGQKAMEWSWEKTIFNQ